jgi:hypothetical protein
MSGVNFFFSLLGAFSARRGVLSQNQVIGIAFKAQFSFGVTSFTVGESAWSYAITLIFNAKFFINTYSLTFSTHQQPR